MTITLRPHQHEAVNAMWQNNKGQVIIPTGGGKTICMIDDAITNMEVRHHGQTFVVVAPRILLAEQLCSEFLEVIDTTHTHIMHVHSGETSHFSTTKAEKINLFVNTARTAGENVVIFTTYHSLHRLVEADIEVNTIYFDEAHNSVQRNFFPATEHFSADADRCYFFTATPKHSLSIYKPGMNDYEVYGKVICNIPAPTLVEQGYILPPKVVVKQLDMVQDKQMIADRDCQNLIETIDENSLDKILIAARSTKQIIKLLSQSDFRKELSERGYSCLYITSKTGAIIDGQKVNREVFFDTLNAWGKDPSKKFVVLHHSILSEGINVSGLEAVLFMRNMDYIGISQSIGRVIRLGGPQKTFGLVCVPVYDKVGISTAKSVQAVVDTVFNRGEAAVSVIRR
ncbi:helicase [Synechococcus phage S-SKS1]|uniref:Helicase n=1 Tax=Synechococcus phage S-SKS1 TaxID=754042 RepID=M4QTM6_9CAUD|nr:helicase [Synechococcus phage S-SKS1]AGH31749.1 helicase [Synechococcus phage S-SKS1]